MPQVTITDVERALVDSVREQLQTVEQRAAQEKAVLAARLSAIYKAHGVPEGAVVNFTPQPDGTMRLSWAPAKKAASSPIPPRRQR